MATKERGVKRWYWEHIATDLQKARHELRVSDSDYARDIAEAKKSKNYKRARELDEEWGQDVDGARATVDRLTSRYWVNRTRKYHIPEPDYGKSPYWDQNNFFGGYNLTVAGIDWIQNRLYEKGKKRWEFWLAFTPGITALTGLIGTIIGLAAILKK